MTASYSIETAGKAIDMRGLASIPAMIVLAGVLSAPLIFEAQISLTDPVPLAYATVLPTTAPANAIVDQRKVLFSGSDAGYSVVLSLDGTAGTLIVIPGTLIQTANDKLMIAGATRDQRMQY